MRAVERVREPDGHWPWNVKGEPCEMCDAGQHDSGYIEHGGCLCCGHIDYRFPHGAWFAPPPPPVDDAPPHSHWARLRWMDCEICGVPARDHP
jgi:hypothetical protein